MERTSSPTHRCPRNRLRAVDPPAPDELDLGFEKSTRHNGDSGECPFRQSHQVRARRGVMKDLTCKCQHHERRCWWKAVEASDSGQGPIGGSQFGGRHDLDMIDVHPSQDILDIGLVVRAADDDLIEVVLGSHGPDFRLDPANTDQLKAGPDRAGHRP